jgi:hypothetical protein
MIRCTRKELDFLTAEAAVSNGRELKLVPLGYPITHLKRGLKFQYTNDTDITVTVLFFRLTGPDGQTHERTLGATVKPGQLVVYSAKMDKEAYELV